MTDAGALQLTAAQRKAVQILAVNDRIPPREFAKQMWPDSSAWVKDTRRHDGRSGAMGGTMPMVGARLLWRLRDRGLATEIDGRWFLTRRGHDVAAGR